MVSTQANGVCLAKESKVNDATATTAPRVDVGGYLFDYRPEIEDNCDHPSWFNVWSGTSWDATGRSFNLDADSGYNSASKTIRDEAYAMHALRRPGFTPAVAPDESKDEGAASGLGATPEQLTRLRALVSSERDAIRLARENTQLRGDVERLSSGSITSYDDRLRPMMEDLAALAADRGFCSEFEVVLDHIGAPSREELTPSRSYDVRIRVEGYTTITVEAANIDDAYTEANNVEMSEVLDAIAGDMDLNSWSATSAELSE